jgi:uncharacterized protein (DUF302 family)
MTKKGPTMPVDGLLTWSSALNASLTLGRLKSAIGAAGLAIFAHVDHAAAAQAVGLDLPPLDVVLFGNPKAGTPLMAASPTLGIDLPLKALVWQDEAGAVFLSFNALEWLAARHHLPDGFAKSRDAMSSLQSALARKATSRSTGD